MFNVRPLKTKMFLKRDHFKRKTVFQPAGRSRWFWHKRFKFGDGSPTSPVSHTCLVSKRPDLVRWLKKHCYPHKCWDWGNTGCMVPCENIPESFAQPTNQSWNQVKYKKSTAIQNIQSYSTSIQFICCTNVWAAIGHLPLGMLVLWMLWVLPSTMYTLQMSQMLWREFPTFT